MEQQTTKAILRGRLSYPHIFEPYAHEAGQEPKYSLCLLIDKEDAENVAKAKAAINAAVDEGVATKWGGKKPARLHSPLRDGDEERPDAPEYAGMYFMNCNSKSAPGVVLRYRDPNTKKPIPGDENTVYSGCYVNVSVNFYPYSTSGNNGVAVGLNNIQKWEDGERLGGKSNAEDDFSFEDTPEAGFDDDMFS